MRIYFLMIVLKRPAEWLNRFVKREIKYGFRNVHLPGMQKII